MKIYNLYEKNDSCNREQQISKILFYTINKIDFGKRSSNIYFVFARIILHVIYVYRQVVRRFVLSDQWRTLNIYI